MRSASALPSLRPVKAAAMRSSALLAEVRGGKPPWRGVAADIEAAKRNGRADIASGHSATTRFTQIGCSGPTPASGSQMPARQRVDGRSAPDDEGVVSACPVTIHSDICHDVRNLVRSFTPRRGLRFHEAFHATLTAWSKRRVQISKISVFNAEE